MAKLKANDVGFYYNSGTPSVPVWKLLACLTDTNIDLAVEEVNGDSKCGIDREAGDGTWTASFEGFYKLDPTVNEISGDGLIDLAKAKTSGQWKIANGDNSYYREFTAYISSYSEGAPYNEFVTFSGELNISGDVETEPTT
ncbi:phage tail tube protein [Chitinophaga sp.]|uniref:phage tail tube protein n=1 Tax=Chitinophaga sp. TaxID=1869181 RepID=UPI0031D137EE